MSTATPQKFEFQAEIKQLLDIVIHSLYTEKEIFVRELVSNASDALEKLRHTQLTEKDIQDDKLGLEINLTTDDKAKTLTIQDYGIGMTVPLTTKASSPPSPNSWSTPPLPMMRSSPPPPWMTLALPLPSSTSA